MKKIKKALLVTCLFGLFCSVPAMAEEETEFEVGTRMNPYAWDEEIDFGTYQIGDSTMELSYQLEGFMSEEDVAEYEDDRLIYDADTVYIKGTIKTGEGSDNDNSLYTYLCSKLYSVSANECWCSVYLFDEETKTNMESYTFSYSDYTFIVECYGANGMTSEDMSLLELYYLLGDDEYTTWVDISDMPYVGEESEDTESGELVDGMRPEFKEAMDSYEAFMDEYCEFMKTYAESDDPTALLSEYMDFMTQYSETMEALDAWESEDMNDAELAYYTQVSLDISQKLIEAAGY